MADRRGDAPEGVRRQRRRGRRATARACRRARARRDRHQHLGARTEGAAPLIRAARARVRSGARGGMKAIDLKAIDFELRGEYITLDALLKATALPDTWKRLPPETYLRDGGHCRRRRHSCFIVDAAAVRLVAHRAHWQPVEYNALHGGLERWVEPIAASVVESPAWTALLRLLAAQASAL